ncbi:MAG: phenylalanine--tRNA ligase subunit alpha [Candidatus Omnitrophica bacterium]|nr:phenylalanine--tRNA ligase subunit alpha [Candidatus Omnitrophota bacterium]
MIAREEIAQIVQEFETDLAQAGSAEALEKIRIKYLGRKSRLSRMFAKIPSLPPREKGVLGKELNVTKQKIAAKLEEKSQQNAQAEEGMDLTFPGEKISHGGRHLLSRVLEDICTTFENLGFSVKEGAEIDDEWHNFSALNIPLEHPSRDVFDTFYLNLPAQGKGKLLLRSHTSPSQIHFMEEASPPFAIVSPGRVYRPDQVDATHSFMFHQVEGFAVSEHIRFSDLKGVLLRFAKTYFGPGVELRFRPHFFPFTEPSAEVDISCFSCAARDSDEKCSICKGSRWIEILGCGMIHPHVLSACKIDPQRYRGFAFGMGVERIAMLRYRIPDIRLFYENDVRFLEQFRS